MCYVCDMRERHVRFLNFFTTSSMVGMLCADVQFSVTRLPSVLKC